MKHLKSYKLFESYEPWAGDASEIIRDYKSEFTDLGFDVSSTEVTTYQINDDKIITCLYFEVSKTYTLISTSFGIKSLSLSSNVIELYSFSNCF